MATSEFTSTPRLNQVRLERVLNDGDSMTIFLL
jgi:hypothetical protein